MQDDQVYKLTYEVLDELLKQRSDIVSNVNEYNNFDEDDVEMFTKLFALTDDTIVKVLSVALSNGKSEDVSDQIMEVMNKFMKNKLDLP
jgi:hypothetical protein